MTALNVASIAVTVALFTVFALVYRKFRRYVNDAEGALAMVSAAVNADEPPRDGTDDIPLPSIVYTNGNE